MASKRKNENDGGGERKHRKLNNEDLQKIINMVRINNDKTRINITSKLIADIAKMARENELQRNATKQSREKRNYNVEDRDIREISRIVEQNRKNVRIPRNAFSVNQVQTHRRMGYNEYVYNVRIGAGNVTTLPEFYDSLREVFNYLINIMNYIASSPTDKARFYISNAPRTAFSTAVLNISDFNVAMFFDIFERHMQSNAQEVINDGWTTTVSYILIFLSYIQIPLTQDTGRDYRVTFVSPACVTVYISPSGN